MSLPSKVDLKSKHSDHIQWNTEKSTHKNSSFLYIYIFYFSQVLPFFSFYLVSIYLCLQAAMNFNGFQFICAVYILSHTKFLSDWIWSPKYLLKLFLSFHQLFPWWEIDFLHLGCLYLKQFLHHFTSFHCIAVGNNRIWNNVLEYKCCLFNLPLLLFTTFLTQTYLKHKQFQLQWGKIRGKGGEFLLLFVPSFFRRAW